MKKWKITAAMGLILAILILLQQLLVPKYMTRTPEGALIGEYYRERGCHDVVFIGDCEVYENFSPVTLWREYGIPSFIRGSPQQTIWQSCYLLEETLRRETPRVVVFNVLAMQYDTPEATGRSSQREAYNRMTLDTMAWSASKWRAIQSSMTAEEWAQGGVLLYLFPILRYHSRWNQLTAEDWEYWLHRESVSHNGYLMQTGVRPVTDPIPEPPMTRPDFGANSYAYLDKIAALCQRAGAQLVLIKAPSLSPVWYDAWDAKIKQYAADHGLTYYNLLEYQQEMGLDWNADTYDGGLHLNVWGAEKAARWLGRQLQEDFDLPDRRKDPALAALWKEKEERYENEKTGG